MTSPNPRPNMMYEWKGFPYPPLGWRYSKETMAKLDAENRIWYPRLPDGTFDITKRPRVKKYLTEMSGGVMGEVWTDISPVNSQAIERLGYPTQKPLPLLERIIKASSNEGDMVLDPFCGCGLNDDSGMRSLGSNSTCMERPRTSKARAIWRYGINTSSNGGLSRLSTRCRMVERSAVPTAESTAGVTWRRVGTRWRNASSV